MLGSIRGRLIRASITPSQPLGGFRQAFHLRIRFIKRGRLRGTRRNPAIRVERDPARADRFRPGSPELLDGFDGLR